MEKCTIIVNARDRFSCTAECLEGLLANSPEAQEIIGVFGGARKTVAGVDDDRAFFHIGL